MDYCWVTLFISSDASPIVEYTRNVIYLDDGEMISIMKSEYTITEIDSNKIVTKTLKEIDLSIEEIEKGQVREGVVKNITDFGAFLELETGIEGLVHISELADKRVAKVTDVVKEGDEVKVKVIGFDRGKVKLSIKQAAI